ncbi:phosphoethanolamine transferase EptA [Gilliamella sp. B2824]|uniref:phosphoethanolamine transferase EptA n=1 Tax=Gilliamella sp. B2824 TaxID=2818019 RepID=UPI00226AEB0E|nr:phosphoethanolamine transferase EptA [Gilliamella sp. B2824]MCX8738238.1 phosphoethanolamine transferase EptA [Gilliamella sp. B2824]
MKRIIQMLLTRPISLRTLIVSVAVYQATILNISFYKQVLIKLSLDSIENIAFFISMPVVVFCVIFILLTLLLNQWLVKIVASSLVIIGSALSYFMLRFGIMIDRSMLQNTLETSFTESASLITFELINCILLLGILPSIVIILVKIKPRTIGLYFLFKHVMIVLLALLLVGLIALIFYKNYATFMRNNSKIIKYLLPSNYIGALYGQYQFEQNKNRPFLTIGDDAHRQVVNSDSEAIKTVVVLIVGETARSENFALNGYGKNTTPLLSKRDDVISFQNTTSCGTYTAFSIPCMFSNMSRKNYDEALALRQENILDILNKQGINVIWLDNNTGCKGVCNRIENENITKKYLNSGSKLCQDGACYDEVLVNELATKLQHLDKDSLIVLHPLGSHGPNYYQRYPEQFRTFTPTCDTNQITNCDLGSLVNTYDNTIVYTDYIINQTIELLQRKQNKYNTMLIYLSDHGESLGENGLYLHSFPYSIAPTQQTKIPFILWISKHLANLNHINTACIQNHAKQDLLSHDNLFHLLLGIFAIQTKEYNQSLDSLNSCKNARG